MLFSIALLKASEEKATEARRASIGSALMPYLVPPLNYGMVEYDLTRSGVVHQLNFSFLERLGLRTVLYLSEDDPSQEFLEFLRQKDINFLREACSPDSISLEQASNALKVILSPEHYPLHVMCKLGIHATGTVIGCLRKLQRWNLASIFEEHRRYASTKVRVLNEQFIELFDPSLVQIPPNYPDWL